MNFCCDVVIDLSDSFVYADVVRIEVKVVSVMVVDEKFMSVVFVGIFNVNCW